jgi:hypothetical protein
MSDGDDTVRESRPWDPAGTQPKHDPAELLPDSPEPLLPPEAEVVESDAVDDSDGGGGGDLLPERRARAASPAPVKAARSSSYSGRFHFLTGALVAVGIAAVAGIAVLIIGPSTSTPGPAWSPWKPTDNGLDGATQIARHVAPAYREDGSQLVNVEASGLSIQGVPLLVALRRAPEQGGQIQIHDEKGVLYQLCGLGPSCAIDRGKASKERALLLRREGLELALYTFRYLKGVKQVVVMIPPATGKAQTVALYFQRDEVKAELSRPLTASLVPKAPTVSNVTLSPDATLVDQTTEPYLFTFNGSSINGAFLVLEPYTTAGDEKLQKERKAQQLQQQAAAQASGG